VSSSSVNEPRDGVSSGTAQSGATEQTKVGFVRSIGLPTAIAINMTQMCGIGPFITIPLMVAAFGGPQAILGWIASQLTALKCREPLLQYDSETATLPHSDTQYSVCLTL
jgi:hypothetical protein